MTKKKLNKPLPDYVVRRLPRSRWKALEEVPTWNGVLYYDPEDLHLNNWWLYLFDYNGAKELEAKLQRDL